MNDVASLIPTRPSFEKLSSQSVEIHRATSGLHAYYPIHFEKKYFLELDAMFHVCVTSIRYQEIVVDALLLDPLLRRPLLDPITENSETSLSNHDSLTRTLFPERNQSPTGHSLDEDDNGLLDTSHKAILLTSSLRQRGSLQIRCSNQPSQGIWWGHL